MEKNGTNNFIETTYKEKKLQTELVMEHLLIWKLTDGLKINKRNLKTIYESFYKAKS